MTLGELAADTRHHFVRSSRIVAAISLVVALVVIGIYIGVASARIRPEISRIEIIGSSNIPAGSHITVRIRDNIPAACIGRTRREIDMDPPPGWPAGRTAPADLLPSDSTPDDRPNNIPIPFGSATGCGNLVITRDMSGCGALSGLLAGRPAISAPIRVCVMPPVLPAARK